jgi:hypothetical protein
MMDNYFCDSKKVGSTSGIDLYILVQLDFKDSKNYIFWGSLNFQTLKAEKVKLAKSEKTVIYWLTLRINLVKCLFIATLNQ